MARQSRTNPAANAEPALIPGELLLAEDPIQANVGRATVTLEVTNRGDRPIQVGSHFHFFEVNRALVFDRAASFGMRLNIPSGNAVRFEPGQTHRVTLVALGGQGVGAWLQSAHGGHDTLCRPKAAGSGPIAGVDGSSSQSLGSTAPPSVQLWAAVSRLNPIPVSAQIQDSRAILFLP